MNLFGPRIYNLMLRRRLSGRELNTLAERNLESLEHLRLNEPARSHRFVVVDLETTGLNKKRDRVVSVGAFRIVEGRIRLGEIFSELVNPGRSIPSESIMVHAITPDAIRTARPAWEVFQDFLEFLGTDILVAHHAQFDLHFINRVMREQHGFKIQNLVLDTILMCRHALPDPDFLGVSREAKRCSLDNLTELFGLKAPERHTALGDAMITALIFQRLLLILERAGYTALRALVKLAGVW
ncbi:MAG: 3'-5' exonuclease [Pseudomonadota bacterium]